MLQNMLHSPLACEEGEGRVEKGEKENVTINLHAIHRLIHLW